VHFAVYAGHATATDLVLAPCQCDDGLAVVGHVARVASAIEWPTVSHLAATSRRVDGPRGVVGAIVESIQSECDGHRSGVDESAGQDGRARGRREGKAPDALCHAFR
jgi:hypothetical protein